MAQGALGVAGELIGSRYGQGAANTTTQLGGAAAQGLFLLPNSRTQESEADVVGQRLMAQAGFDPRAAVNLWQRSEEHTSELQSLMRISYAVFCLKKKNQTNKRKKSTYMINKRTLKA